MNTTATSDRPNPPTLVCHRSRVIHAVAVGGLVVLVAGCSSVQHTVGGWFGVTPTPTPKPTPQEKAGATSNAPRVYYAGSAMTVYSEASSSSKVVGQLSLHEKVTRTKLERGFAYVESAKSGVKGWVVNAQLLWRLPKTSSNGQAPAQATPEEEEAPAEEAPVAEPTPEPTQAVPEPTKPAPAAPRAKATPGGVAPSIFNPY